MHLYRSIELDLVKFDVRVGLELGSQPGRVECLLLTGRETFSDCQHAVYDNGIDTLLDLALLLC